MNLQVQQTRRFAPDHNHKAVRADVCFCDEVHHTEKVGQRILRRVSSNVRRPHAWKESCVPHRAGIAQARLLCSCPPNITTYATAPLVRPQRPVTVPHRTVALEGPRAGGSPNVGYRPVCGRVARPGGPSQNAAHNGDSERKQKVHTSKDG